MKQPVRKVIKTLYPDKKAKIRKKYKDYGTSKLEEYFAHEFLDKIGVRYIYQFEAKSIKRFYDFFIPDANLLIEIDGDYYHSYGKIYEEMSPMQKRNKRVDELKNRWALINGVPLLRIWEHDINKEPSKVMDLLKEKIGESVIKKNIEENKKNKHFKNIKK